VPGTPRRCLERPPPGSAERISGLLRPGIAVHDLGLILEQIAAIRFVHDERTETLRRRHLAISLDGLRAPSPEPLPGPPPTWQEINEHWAP
jgi:hypothetical protein